MMSRSMYSKSLDERLLEIAGIGFLIDLHQSPSFIIIPRRSRRDIVLASSVHPSTLFVCPEPYLSTYWSDLINSWYK